VKSEASWAALQAGLATHGLTIADVNRVIITHPHVDHFGQAALIVANSDAQVWVSSLGHAWLVDFPTLWRKRIAYYRNSFLDNVGFSSEESALILDYMSQTVSTCDPVPAERVSTFPLNGRLCLGGSEWQIIHTPGHASHQTCFYQPESRQFLSADMLLAKTPTPIVERPLSGDQRIPSLPRFLESLSLVEALDIDIVYPGHGQPFDEHRQLIARQRRRIEQRKAECLELIRVGFVTPAQLVAQMYTHFPPQFRFAGLWMLTGYLDLLKADGQVVELEVDGVWHYRPAAP
jgi:glyoxylase-like metal-dependent hydrolase (beta-lactamase superfamily II)